jgi:hypothetical protein
MKIATILSLALSLASVTAKVSVRGSSGKDSFLETIDRSRRLTGKDGKGGKGSSSSDDKGACEYPEGDDPKCTICDQCNKVRPEMLRFRYNAVGVDSVYQPEDKATCRAGSYPSPTTITAVSSKDPTEIYFTGVVSDGDVFEISPPEGGRFEAETDFIIEGWGGGVGDDAPNTCFIHTSCSVPLAQDDQIGPFTVLAGTGCDEGECISVDKTDYECGENITVSFDFAYPESEEGKLGALVDDWIGIYPCKVGTDYPILGTVPATVGTHGFKHSEAWLWTCPDVYGANFLSCGDVARSAGTITFSDPIPAYNAFAGHQFPIAPFYNTTAKDTVNTCFKAVLLRFDGPSVPPYVKVCESPPFNIAAVPSDPRCQIRDSSKSFPARVPA